MRPRAFALYGVKIAVSASALVYLSRQIDLAALGGRITAFWSWNLLAAEVFFVAGVALANRRWQIILERQGSPVSFWTLFRIGWIANFFGMFLPAGAGRDLVRGAYLTRLDIRVLESTRSILTDRFVGFGGLVLLSVPCLAWIFWAHPETRVVAWALALVCGGLVLGLLLLKTAVPRLEDGRLARGEGFMARAIRLLSMIARDFLDPSLAGRPLVLSCLTQTTLIASVYSIGVLDGAQTAPLWAYVLFLPVIFLLIQLPISVAGLGVREAAFVSLFGAVGIAAEASLAVSLTFFALAVINNIAGAAFYMLRGDGAAAPKST